MNKLLCIVGPTGTGKTARAVEEAQKTPSIIISADSRQVYRGMDIVTGKDHPKGIKIYGIDIVDPDESCSVAVWHDAVMPHIKKSWQESRQVIVVGGTGLYVKALTDGIPTMQVPINQPLRDELSSLSITELQQKLKLVDVPKFDSMNNSDSNNPRRLIRAIEVARFLHFGRNDETICHLEQGREISKGTKFIGLKHSVESIQRNKIRARVISRLEQGAVEETQLLLSKYTKNFPSMSAIGYRSIINFIENKCTKQEMIDSWVEGELAYSKRQFTWFRKQPVIWYDIDIYGNTKN